MDGGTYTLVLERASGATIEVGALGAIDFPAGWYAYTGSALGAGGFSRVDRHRAVAAGENDARHWHVDYLLGDDATGVETVVTTAADIECGVARRLAEAVGGAVPDFGCSDCGCRSHLVRCEDRETLVAAVERAHGEASACG
ncbi:GIY-YIG nuclease family protein [Haloarcula sediminis]|uniref:GIY-YIG nuclease family protein n=1 Tax=Haloarcula sediminis TaxID=3111777 RepID=UPI002D77C6C7|nr:GIY-YIG nuclease family protein [Haloarcula sp. CK38]